MRERRSRLANYLPLAPLPLTTRSRGADSGGKCRRPDVTAYRLTVGHRPHCTAATFSIYSDEFHPLLP